MPDCLKKKILDTAILPSMTYNAKTWTLSTRQENKLKDVIERISSMTRQWAGQVEQQQMGKDHNRTDTQRRKKEKRQTQVRWRGDIEEKAGKTWTHIVRDSYS